MNVYDLARELRVKKSSLQGLIAAMTSEFEELAETPSGLLYWKGCKTPAQSEGNRVTYKSWERLLYGIHTLIFMMHLTRGICCWLLTSVCMLRRHMMIGELSSMNCQTSDMGNIYENHVWLIWNMKIE